MTILPLCRTVAGLNVPADSQVMPWGERRGSFEARVQGPKGRSTVCPAKASEPARSAIDITNRVFLWSMVHDFQRNCRWSHKRKLAASLRPGIEERGKRINAEDTESAEFAEKRGRRRYGFFGFGRSNCMVRTMPSPSLTKIT